MAQNKSQKTIPKGCFGAEVKKKYIHVYSKLNL